MSPQSTNRRYLFTILVSVIIELNRLCSVTSLIFSSEKYSVALISSNNSFASSMSHLLKKRTFSLPSYSNKLSRLYVRYRKVMFGIQSLRKWLYATEKRLRILWSHHCNCTTWKKKKCKTSKWKNYSRCVVAYLRKIQVNVIMAGNRQYVESAMRTHTAGGEMLTRDICWNKLYFVSMFCGKNSLVGRGSIEISPHNQYDILKK